jgi:hypothetical protein
MATAAGFLLDPPRPRVVEAERDPPGRPVVAVVGLAPRCGASTIARALAAELARRDPARAALVTCAVLPPASVIASQAARRLARAVPAGAARAAGRLALVDAADPALRGIAAARAAPLVLDVPHGVAPEPALALADHALLVASPSVEPALAWVAATTLAREGLAPVVVLNRAADAEGWHGRADVELGESRVGARLAVAGREPAGALGAAVGLLADACAGVPVHA